MRVIVYVFAMRHSLYAAVIEALRHPRSHYSPGTDGPVPASFQSSDSRVSS